MTAQNLQISALFADYESGARTPSDVISRAYAAAKALLPKHVWICLFDEAAVLAQLADVETRRAAGEELPLFGVPFAIKDNIDFQGVPTTAACPSFAKVPAKSAAVVERLQAAGAICFGKTNLDQFATGLVGTRSPYGACSSVCNEQYISGGSSSGSAVSVAAGAVSFALGTDTAGSGRIPAGFNNIFGLKPSKGLLSTRGVVPACRSLDCVSIFAGNADDAARVLVVAAASDAQDPFSRKAPSSLFRRCSIEGLRIGVPRKEQLEFFGDTEAAKIFDNTVTDVAGRGATLVEFDFQPFREVADLLYSGAWVAERFAAVGAFLESEPHDANPTVSTIIRGGKHYTAVQAFEANYKLQALSKVTATFWDKADVMLLPTAGTAYTHAQVAEQPVQYNSNLGYYTNFVNLLDMSAIALPAGFKANGMPAGISLLGRAFDDLALAQLAAQLTAPQSQVGGTEIPVFSSAAFLSSVGRGNKTSAGVSLAVVGAHLRGQPLHSQLTELGAVFARQTTTSADYELYALSGTTPAKPGLMRVTSGGAQIEVEVFSLSVESFGRFTALVPAPLGIGNVELADGSVVKGFICEGFAQAAAKNITAYGGWRRFLAAESN